MLLLLPADEILKDKHYAEAIGVKAKVFDVAGVGSKICNRKLREALAALALKKVDEKKEEYDPEMFVTQKKMRRLK